MTKSDLSQKLVQIFSKTLRLQENKISSDANVFKQLGADSLDILSLAAAIEGEFDIDISDDEVKVLYSIESSMKLLIDRGVIVPEE